jgi:PhnB protein
MKMTVTPYLSFNGQCEEAFKLYEQCLGGKITFMMTWGDSPMSAETPPGWGKKIMHSTLTFGDNVLQGADSLADQYQKPQGFSISVGLSGAAEAERIFNTLAEKGTVQMPLEETFWALRFGMLVDQFGIPWLINCEKSAQA